jgi:WD40 repeat protein
LADFHFLEAKTGRVAVDDLLANLRNAAELAPARFASRPQLGAMQQVLAREQRHLLAWDRNTVPAFFAQQVYNRSVELGLRPSGRAAATRLAELGQFYLEQRWRAGPPDTGDEGPYGLSYYWNIDTVWGLAVTPDGRLAVSAHLDGTLKVWEVATGRQVHTLTGHQAMVLAVAVTPDGRQAVSGSQDGTLKVWQMETGQLRHTLAGHEGTPFAVRITPDGRRALSRADDGSLRVWDLASGRALHALGGRKPPYFFTGAYEEDWMEVEIPDLICGISEYALAVTPDGRRAMGAFSGGLLWDETPPGDVVRVWDLEEGREVHSLRGHRGPVSCVAVAPDGCWAVSASEDHTARVWSLETGHLAHTLSGHTDRVHAVLVTPDSRHVLSASADRTIRIWDLHTGQLLRTLAGHTDEVYALALARDGRCVVSASLSGGLKVWELASGRPLAMLPLAGGRPQVAVAGHGDTILAGDSAGNVYCLDSVDPDGTSPEAHP